MGFVFVVIVGLIALVLAVAVLSVIGPYIAGIGIIAALLVVLNPGGVGARVRRSIGWWGIPGMRRASGRAASFAALLLLYSVPGPLGAFALAHSSGGGTTPSATRPLAGVGGGSTAAASSPATAVVTASATATGSPSVAPTAIPAPPTALPPAVPTVVPPTPPPPVAAPRNLCGAPSNPWNYNFCGSGRTISSPPSDFCVYFTTCIASFSVSTKGYVEECRDGTYSHSGGRPGSCSSHGGNLRPLNP